jgi:hypothetical protein
MKTLSIFAVTALLAASSFAQTGGSSTTNDGKAKSPVWFIASTAGAPSNHTNYRLHSRLYDVCCASSATSSGFGGGASSSYQDTIVTAHGDPDWTPSHFLAFPKAVSLGNQQAGSAPGQARTAAMVQQMLYLIQQERIAASAQANRVVVSNGSAAPPATAADAEPSSASAYVPYDQAVALGGEEVATADAPPTPLGDEARNDLAEKATEPKAAIKIKQDADGNPVIIEKKKQ